MELIHRYVDANTGKTCPHDIRVVREPDKGLYDAMNKALEHATGDYIVFHECRRPVAQTLTPYNRFSAI